jgi:DNA-binding GntR family transcriptional regulator
MDAIENKKERRSLRQKVYEGIMQEIVTCKLPPGATISELQFVEQFQVSKTPIREALTALQKDGLVHYTPNRGFMVAPISIRDVQEIFDARIFFETNLFHLALANLNEENIAILETLSLVEEDTSSPAELDSVMKTNELFHLEIARIAGNSRLFEYYRTLLNEAQRLIYLDLKNSNITHIWHTSHHTIMDAIRNRDEQTGIGCIREVLLKAKRRILGTE